MNQDDSLEHGGMPRERSLDFSKFDPEAANFDLMIAAAKVLNISVRPVTREVSSLIQPSSRLATERIRNEFIAGQVRPSYITSSQTYPTNVQVSGNTDRNSPKQIIQDIYLCVRYRTAYGDIGLATGLFNWPVGRVDDRLSRAVNVV